MDEIVSQVVRRTGIPEDKARMAVQVVLGQLRGRLPAPLASQLDSAVAGGAAGRGGAAGGLGGLGDVARKGLGGMLGG